MARYRAFFVLELELPTEWYDISDAFQWARDVEMGTERSWCEAPPFSDQPCSTYKEFNLITVEPAPQDEDEAREQIEKIRKLFPSDPA